MERRVKNLKLKYSRMLTCFSAIAYLLYCFSRDGAVSPEAARDMAKITPIDRLDEIKHGTGDMSLKTEIDEVVGRYQTFLQETNKPEPQLLEHMKSNFDRMRSEAHTFGDHIFEVITKTGKNSRLHRMVVV